MKCDADIVKAYKIRDRDTGLFSTGGCDPGWNKIGKTWSTEGQVKSHLKMWSSEGAYKHKKVPESWEVLCLTFAKTAEDVTSARALAERPAKR